MGEALYTQALFFADLTLLISSKFQDRIKEYLFCKNFNTPMYSSMQETPAEIIDIRSGATSAEDFMSLGAGEFAFFQWAADEDLNYDADSGTPVLEVMVFEK